MGMSYHKQSASLDVCIQPSPSRGQANSKAGVLTRADYAGWCGKIHGESFPISNGFLNIVQREPLGVCAAITAFNAPIMGMAMKAAPCLATGNTLVLKSSERSPLSTLYLGKLANEAGFPPGVLNIVSGGELTGNLLAKHMNIDQISFTGSVGVGKQIAQAASQSNLKRVALEMGGKSPSIIFPDAKLDVAIPWCVNGILVLSGQVCFASSRVYVHESIKKQVVDQMKSSFESMDKSFGDPLDEDVEFPPLVNQGHFERVKGFIDRSKEEATLVTGGQAMFSKVCIVPPKESHHGLTRSGPLDATNDFS